MDDVTINAAAARQVGYHLRMAAALGVGGQLDESASETLLAWALLDVAWPEAGAEADAADLIDQDRIEVSNEQRGRAVDRARALALELQAHFASVGQSAEHTLYERAAEGLGTTVGRLGA